MTLGRFWEEKSLAEMSREEWESLCDGCARCCLIKLEDEETEALHYTGVACRYLDRHKCQCTAYADRTRLVPDCLELSMDNVDQLYWMPQSCAYRLLDAGRPLPEWHPLISGNPDSVHEAGISVRGFAISEDDVDSVEDLEAYIID
ncbi:MAG: YcgN family cysteine cluster protein [Pseudomonadota bacterium]